MPAPRRLVERRHSGRVARLQVLACRLRVRVEHLLDHFQIPSKRRLEERVVAHRLRVVPAHDFPPDESADVVDGRTRVATACHRKRQDQGEGATANGVHTASPIFAEKTLHRGSPRMIRKNGLAFISVMSPPSRWAYARPSHSNAASASPRAACTSAI